MTDVERVYKEIREEQMPYFDNPDDEIAYYLDKNGGDVNATIYELLILKSEDSSLALSGMTTQDTSNYFKRLASRYRRYNSGVLGGD